jgi:hypothetical protein
VLLTANTTTASFGALIFARHQGLQSLGQALTLGVTTCLAASIVFFPALLAWLTRNRPAEASADASTELTEKAVESNEPSDVNPPTTATVQPIPPVVPAEPFVPEVASPPPLPPAEAPRPIEPAPVTDEEIAALLETALFPRRETVAFADDSTPVGSENASAAAPRRRELPRRSDAA